MLSNSSKSLLSNYFQNEIYEYFLIDNSASDRKNYRIICDNKNYILTEGNNISENNSFIYFSEIFKNAGISVPNILIISDDRLSYLQEDLGENSLYEIILNEKETDFVKQLFFKTIKQLIKVQTIKTIDYNKCIDFKIFDEKVVYQDVFYYKYYYLDILGIPYHKRELIDDIEHLGNKVNELPKKYFLYRDFQSRNIFIKDSQPYFIDYQSGMQGFPCYDLVSMIWQAKIQLSHDLKEELKKYYYSEFQLITGESIENIDKSYQISLIIRFLQLLGAYGLRGIIQKKKHFKESILYHFKNLEYLIENNYLDDYPEIKKSIKSIISLENVNKIKML